MKEHEVELVKIVNGIMVHTDAFKELELNAPSYAHMIALHEQASQQKVNLLIARDVEKLLHEGC